MSTATETIAFLANYNSWRRGDETLEMPAPTEIGATIDDAVNLLRKHDELERELAHEREASRLLKVAMDVREEGHTQSRRRMNALESELTAKAQAVRNLAAVISGQDKELERERAKVRLLRSACESICEEWGRNHDSNPIGAGQKMETLASKALEKLEDAT